VSGMRKWTSTGVQNGRCGEVYKLQDDYHWSSVGKAVRDYGGEAYDTLNGGARATSERASQLST
jgi:hypothetical protein